MSTGHASPETHRPPNHFGRRPRGAPEWAQTSARPVDTSTAAVGSAGVQHCRCRHAAAIADVAHDSLPRPALLVTGVSRGCRARARSARNASPVADGHGSVDAPERPLTEAVRLRPVGVSFPTLIGDG